MVMVMVYNLADTFFIGLTNNDYQVSAVSYATPVFMLFMSLGTLFGVGGTSVISRALGAGKKDYAKKVSSFCMWCCVGLGLLFMIILWVFTDKFIVMLGAGEQTMEYTRTYLKIAIGCGVFSMVSNCFSNIIRTEGQPMKAMTGTLIGNLLNVILDPIMILGFKWGIAGAAIATVIGNVVSAGYYLMYFLGGKSSLSIHIKHFSAKDGICKGVVSVGISASLANMLVSVSSMVVNGQLSGAANGELLVAGYGVTSKVLMIITLIGIGIGSGVQPIVGFCYGSKNKKRLMETMRFSTIFGLAFCLVISVISFIFAGPIVKVFLTEAEAYESGIQFTRILLSTAWLIGAFVVFQNSLQAMGAATPALLASLFRQGVIFIPAVFIMKALLGVKGIIWAQPVADVLSLVVITFMLLRKLKKEDLLS
ncbi:MAG: MATE family efflux transporter [Blautia sp.]|nr:MATE family efflux transporter [Blautia sp.]